MVMPELVKVTKKEGSGDISVATFETYATTETGENVDATERTIVLTPGRGTQDEMMKATLEGLAQWEAEHGLNQDE